MNLFNALHRFNNLSRRETLMSSTVGVQKLAFHRWFSTFCKEDPELKEFMDYLDNLKNFEKLGVPKGAGTDSDDGFDMGRMNRLMHRLGNPQSKFKAVHIAGTKGKGSTAAFLSNILRQEGYSVGSYTSPHLWSIRERISLGRKGDFVSAKALSCLFHRVRNILDRSIELENGSISHFEVLTAVAFSLFAEENVDIAIIEAGLGGTRDATNVFCSSVLAASVITTIGGEHLDALGGSLESIALAKSGIIKHGRPVVLGGPFEPHIECILRGRASSMTSPVVSASDPGNRSTIKGFEVHNGKLYQTCDIFIQIENDLRLFIELYDVRLLILGRHQLQNAVTAICASLCLREQGWRVSDESIRAGLENTFLLGRSQFLTTEECEAVGLPGVHILVDGAHTKESAKCLSDTIQLTHPGASLALVVAMANDKDHSGFARQLLSGQQPDVVILTEISIAGGRSRMTPASMLKDVWTQVAVELNIDTEMGGEESGKRKTVLAIGGSVEESMKVADEILRWKKQASESRLIVVTGSLHIVSLVLASLRAC